MIVNGTNVSQVSNSFLIESFQNASNQMEELRPLPCVPSVLSLTITNRPGQRLRRSLQQTSTQIVFFSLDTLQVRQGDVVQSWYTEPFMSMFNGIVEVEGIWGEFLAETTSPSWAPSLRPSHLPSHKPSLLPSLQPSQEPSHGQSSEPSHQPSQQPSNGPSLQPSTEPSQKPSAEPSQLPTRLVQFDRQ